MARLRWLYIICLYRMSFRQLVHVVSVKPRQADSGFFVAQHSVKIQNYRPDIDGLRAFAVLSVVLFHVFPSSLPGGFVGVDIFFVISGFLISGIMYKGMDAGTFRFSTFYAHRIKRIFPVLVVMMLACYVFGWFALLPDEFQTLGREMLGGAGFYANLLLWQDTGYFDSVAHTKPLLHLWSLGVEEQFYFTWPLILFAFYRFRRAVVGVIILLVFASFATNLHLMTIDSAGSFFSPLSRFWELLAGAMLALWLRRSPDLYLGHSQRAHDALSLAGLSILLAAVMLLNEHDIAFPGWWALLPVLGACLLIYAGSGALVNRTLLSSPVVVWIGLISYPLYLWHWPLLSFSRIVLEHDLSGGWRILMVMLSILLAWLSWRWIERPIRFGIPGPGKVVALCLLMVIVAWLGRDAEVRHGLPFRINLPASALDDGVDSFPVCNPAIGHGPSAPEFCRRSPLQRPSDSVVFGDSHARSLFPGLANQDHVHSWLLLAHPKCPPTLGVAIGTPKEGQDCSARRERILTYIKDSPAIRTVVLAFFADYIFDDDFAQQRIIDHWAESVQMSSPDYPGASKPELFYHGLENTVKYLTNANKKVIVVMDVPELPFLINDCIKRPLFNMARSCELKRSTIVWRQGKMRSLLQRLAVNNPKVRVFDPLDVFCDRTQCHIMQNDRVIYRDSDHLNFFGSSMLAPAFLSWMRTPASTYKLR